MRKPLLIILCLYMSYHAMAQELQKQNEVGLLFNSLDNFGLTYRIGTDRSLWRFNTLFISGIRLDEVADNTGNKTNNYSFSLRAGREYRKIIVDDLEFRLGADLSFSYSHSKTESFDDSGPVINIVNKMTTYEPGINMVVGFNYVIKEKLILGAELLPGFEYITGSSVEKFVLDDNRESETKRDISGFDFGLSNTSALLSLSYRF